MKQEHNSEIDKLSFAGNLFLEYQDSREDGSMDEQALSLREA